jgi:phosphate-selective porin OprO and OprP
MIQWLSFPAALAVATGVAAAQDQAAEIADLKETVQSLREEVAALRTANGEEWLTQRRAEEIRGLVQDVLADADARASLLQSGVTAGWDKSFFLASPDGNYLVQIGGQIQVRAVYNHQDDDGSSDAHRFGFENRRVKVDFKGHVVDKTWTYYVEMEANRSGGAFALAENGWLQKDFGNGLRLRGGQFKPLFTREESISSRRLQGVERSQVNTRFTAGTAQGVQLMYEQPKWRLSGAFIDGISTANTVWSAEDTEYAFTGRGEFLFTGDWKAIEDDIGFRDVSTAAMLGGGVQWQRAEFGTSTNNAELETLTLTADATFKTGGWSLAGAFFYRMQETDTTDIDRDQFAFVVRGGVFVADDIELYGMYEWGDLDIDDSEDLHVVTAGVTKYFSRHALKWQNDVGYAFDEVSSDWAVDSAGWRADADGQDGQIVIRSQFQLLF